MSPHRQPRNRRIEESVNSEGGQMDPMQTFANMVAEAIQSGNPALGSSPKNRVANFKDFKMVGPPEFRGTRDPIEAQTWMKEMKKVFEVARVAEKQKTTIATFIMKGEADFLWKANKSRTGEGWLCGLVLKNYSLKTIFQIVQR